MTVPDLHERRRIYPPPVAEDAGDIRGIIAEFVLITPAATDLADIGFIFFDHVEKFALERLRKAFPKITIAERIILSRFILYYALPAAAADDKALEECQDLIETAAAVMVSLALAERDVMSLPGDLEAIERLGQVMNSGQPPEVGLWLAYAVIVNLTEPLGHNHYLVELARGIMTARDPRRD